MGKTAVIILQYGNHRATVNCLESVKKYNTAPVKFIIVDNASPNPADISSLKDFLLNNFNDTLILSHSGNSVTPDVENHVLSESTLLLSDINDGYARGNNKGLHLAYNDPEIDTILILNNDVLFVEDIIPHLLRDLQASPDAALITPLLYKRDLRGIDNSCARKNAVSSTGLCPIFFLFRNILGNETVSYIKISPMTGLIPVQVVSGSCILCRKDFFKEIGSFDPYTFLYYEEDILWSKIEKTGKSNYVDTDIKCIHLGASTTTSIPSVALTKATIESQRYYAENYSGASSLSRSLLKLSGKWALSIITLRNRMRQR